MRIRRISGCNQRRCPCAIQQEVYAMKLLKKIPFACNDQEYEVRILQGDNLLNIAVFSNNHPANGFRHQILLPKRADPGKLLKSDVLKDIVSQHIEYTRSGRWSDLNAVLG